MALDPDFDEVNVEILEMPPFAIYMQTQRQITFRNVMKEHSGTYKIVMQATDPEGASSTAEAMVIITFVKPKASPDFNPLSFFNPKSDTKQELIQKMSANASTNKTEAEIEPLFLNATDVTINGKVKLGFNFYVWELEQVSNFSSVNLTELNQNKS